MPWGPKKPKPLSSGAKRDDRNRAKFTQGEVKQNPPKDYQNWMRPGSLCEAKGWLRDTKQTNENLVVARLQSWDPNDEASLLNKGELCTYIGELYRRKIKDDWEPGGVRIEVAHQFLTPRHGIIVADPAAFKDAQDDENLTKTE